MNRRQEIESIVIGTLICHYDDFWPCVRCCVTEDMFTDAFNREIFSIMRNGRVDLKMLADGRGKDEALRLFDLVVDFDFIHKKSEYNESQYLFSSKPRYTNVTFDDYVTRLVKLHYEKSDR